MAVARKPNFPDFGPEFADTRKYLEACAEERTRIVTWLRNNWSDDIAARNFATMIERGDHCGANDAARKR
jgi:hypothetical protein